MPSPCTQTLRTPSLPAPDPRWLVLGTIVALAVVLMALTPGTAHAQNAPAQTKAAYDVAGKLGVGYTTGNAPIGVRYWFSNQLGFDAGFGIVFNGNEPDPEGDPGDTQTTIDFALDAGFLVALWKHDNSILYIRPGLNYDRDWAQGVDQNGPTNSSIDTLNINAIVGFEFFLSQLGFPELALQGGVGLGFTFVSNPEDNDMNDDNDSDWVLGSLATDVSVVANTQLGFRYYFF